MSRISTKTSGARWLWVPAVGVGVAFVTFVSLFVLLEVYLAIVTIAMRGEVEQGELHRFGKWAVVWILPVLYLAYTTGATAWMARRLGTVGVWPGVAAGLAAAVGWNVIGLVFSPPETRELIVYPLFGVAGGVLGCLIGRVSLAGREALYRASRDVGSATNADEIATAIGRHLAGSDVEQVALWTVTSKVEDESLKLKRIGSWSGRAEELWPADECLDVERMPVLAGMRRQSPRTVRRRELPGVERGAWGRRGIRSAVLVPLGVFGEGPDGLLAVASRGRWVSRGTVRAYMTAGAQAALALENLRLVEEARRSGMMRERRRLAHEIHDILIQGFASVVMNLEAAEGALENGSTPLDGPSARRHLDEARRTARESMAEARRMVWALRPGALEGTPLTEALARLSERWSEDGGAVAGLTVTGRPRVLPPETEVTLLRAAQEALVNVRKHARASRVVLTLSYMEDGVTLDVQDDGAGFDAGRVDGAASVPNGAAGGFGLRAMRERVEQSGGTLIVESEPGRGTALAVEIPSRTHGPEDRDAEVRDAEEILEDKL